jgi:hypothetical protein
VLHWAYILRDEIIGMGEVRAPTYLSEQMNAKKCNLARGLINTIHT